MLAPTMPFDPTAYGPEIAAILGDGRKLLPLIHGPADDRFRQAIESVSVPPIVRAGLWAYHYFWAEAHETSQEIDTPEGRFWHAILHRREPDAWNSKYWWRQVGHHALIGELHRDADTIGVPNWSPVRFVDACVERLGPCDLLVRVQLREWQLLFDWCWRSAVG